MNLKLGKILSAVSLAILGGIFILGLTPKSASGVLWRWPFHQSKSVALPPTPVVQASDKQAPKTVALPDEANQTSSSVDASQLVTPSGRRQFVPVLMYHHVGPIDDATRAKDAVRSDLTVTPEDFEAQVLYFKNLGYHTISVQELYDALQNGTALPSKPIIFTFDDGYADVFAYAIPILQKYNYTGSFAIATELLGRPEYAVWDDVINADKEGMEILSHTENHLDLTSSIYSDSDLVREINGSKQILESKLGHPINFFVYPYGHVNYHVGELVAKAGYEMAFTTSFGTYQSQGGMLVEPRVRVHGVDGLDKIKSIFEPKKQTAPVQTNP